MPRCPSLLRSRYHYYYHRCGLRLVKKPAPPPPRLQARQDNQTNPPGAAKHRRASAPSRAPRLTPPPPDPRPPSGLPPSPPSFRRASAPVRSSHVRRPPLLLRVRSSLSLPALRLLRCPELRGFRGVLTSNGYLAAAARADLRSSAWGDQIGARLGALQLNSARGSSRRPAEMADAGVARGPGSVSFALAAPFHSLSLCVFFSLGLCFG